MMIHLNPHEYIAKGTHKKIYIHPLFPDRCIKQAYNIKGIRDLIREGNYLKHKKSSCLPKYHGLASTNLGLLPVFDYITDYDGTHCKNITAELSMPYNNSQESIIEALKKFKQTIIKDSIVCLELFPANLALRNNGDKTYSIYIIDLGDSSRGLHLEYFCPATRKKHMRRRWNNLMLMLIKTSCEHLLPSLRNLIE
ncbi:MAG: hypothetical protein K5838_05915 [Elusimicrobiales bacterium]|nr:hypothetical protein [Elusimicrobiales bacterium]